jgi:hypothetical protein
LEVANFGNSQCHSSWSCSHLSLGVLLGWRDPRHTEEAAIGRRQVGHFGQLVWIEICSCNVRYTAQCDTPSRADTLLLLLLLLLELLGNRLMSLYSSTIFQELDFPSLFGMTSISFSHWLVFKC